MEGIESPALQDLAFNNDGSLKETGKQKVQFRKQKVQSFKARRDENGEVIIDKRTGIPFKDYFEESKIFVRIETKGDTNIVDDVANDFHKRQFIRQYKYFMEGKIPDGNPIEQFEFLQPGTVMELHMLGVHVIQQVAEMSDLECEQLKDQSGFEVRDIAAGWVRAHSPQGQSLKTSKLEKENESLRRQLEAATSGKKQKVVIEAPVSEPVTEVEEATMELTPEELKKGPRRQRLVK